MGNVALVSFLANSLNTRSLSSYLKLHGIGSYCYFCAGDISSEAVDNLVALLKEQQATLLGISLVTDDFAKAVALTKAVKARLDLPVIWGGAHANVMPYECLRHADMICRGEGEEALLDLVKSLEGGEADVSIPNIWFKRADGSIVENGLRRLEENLDKYPFPDFDFSSQFLMEGRAFRPFRPEDLKGFYSIMTSRGCPYSCHYCYNSYRRRHYAGKGKYLRKRSIAHVIDELALAKEVMGEIRAINFWDDSFVARPIEEFKVFKTLYSERIGLPFFALIEPMAFDFEKIRLLKECGLSELQVGIQTGSERVNREVYNRQVSNARVLEVARFIHDNDIEATYDLIFNNPYETLDDMRESVGLLLQFPRPLRLQGYNLIFYPGTQITERALGDGLISERDRSEDDFSTIQSVDNSPIAMRGEGEVSSRFYDIRYDSSSKWYYNSVISIMSYRFVPLVIQRFFASSHSPAKERLLTLFLKSYALASALRHGLTSLLR